MVADCEGAGLLHIEGMISDGESTWGFYINLGCYFHDCLMVWDGSYPQASLLPRDLLHHCSGCFNNPLNVTDYV
jgi:hypothetical protein